MGVRMSEVAARAGVSTQTVSRVMRNSQQVATETADRVRAVMAELGYHGNAAAGALKSGHTRTVGLLFPFLTLSIWSDVAAGAEELAHAHGYSLLLCDTSDSPSKEASYISLLLSQRVAGIVYALPRCRPHSEPACAALVASDIPVVVIGADQHDLPYTHVRTDDERAGYVAIRHLLDLGRRRIALIATGNPTPPDLLPLQAPVQDRLAGVLRAMQDAGLDSGSTPLLVVPNSVEGGRAAGRALIEADGALPDGIFATTDAVGLGVIDALRLTGVAIPAEVAVLAHDGLEAGGVSVPSLTTIGPPRRAMGTACVDLLLRAAAGFPLPSLQMLDAEFIVRESTAGSGPALRRGLATPLSDPLAWSRWRGQATAVGPEEAALVRLTLGQVLGRGEVSRPA